jgi:hypothetical protein
MRNEHHFRLGQASTDRRAQRTVGALDLERGHEVLNVSRGTASPYREHAAWESIENVAVDLSSAFCLFSLARVESRVYRPWLAYAWFSLLSTRRRSKPVVRSHGLRRPAPPTAGRVRSLPFPHRETLRVLRIVHVGIFGNPRPSCRLFVGP